MKQLLLIILFAKATLCFGEDSVDLSQITNKWTQGKISDDGNVVLADVNRGVWYFLNILSDSTLVFGDPFSCGFGHERHGKWILNKVDSSITFFFDKSIGYLNTPGAVNINQTEIFGIIDKNSW